MLNNDRSEPRITIRESRPINLLTGSLDTPFHYAYVTSVSFYFLHFTPFLFTIYIHYLRSKYSKSLPMYPTESTSFLYLLPIYVLLITVVEI